MNVQLDVAGVNKPDISTPRMMIRRGAHYLSGAEVRLYTKKSPRVLANILFQVMKHLEFLPHSPSLMNAGSPLGQLLACFVLPVSDSIDGIYTTLHYMATICQPGRGKGFIFSRLKLSGDLVSFTQGQGPSV